MSGTHVGTIDVSNLDLQHAQGLLGGNDVIADMGPLGTLEGGSG